jgi:SAM-dependent methyltransferase
MKRKRARDLARHYLAEQNPTGWFEALYAESGGDAGAIPWADMAPNPNLVEWLDRHLAGELVPIGARAMKVGCGLGDDAEELARRGYDVVAFDISQTAINWCQLRFPATQVKPFVADLFSAPTEWEGRFHLVVESYTLQVLPPALRPDAMQRIAGFVAPGGTLLVIARGREPSEDEGAMPWPLTRDELDVFTENHLDVVAFEDYLDSEDPPVRRFRVEYRRR